MFCWNDFYVEKKICRQWFKKGIVQNPHFPGEVWVLQFDTKRIAFMPMLFKEAKWICVAHFKRYSIKWSLFLLLFDLNQSKYIYILSHEIQSSIFEGVSFPVFIQLLFILRISISVKHHWAGSTWWGHAKPNLVPMIVFHLHWFNVTLKYFMKFS